MNGKVDNKCRALLELQVGRRIGSVPTPVLIWVDTAFDGHLVFPQEIIEELQLDALAKTEAVLADGSKVVMDTYLCYVDWFGEQTALQVIANEGKFPLLGTALLDQRVLHVDYVTKTVSLE